MAMIHTEHLQTILSLAAIAGIFLGAQRLKRCLYGLLR